MLAIRDKPQKPLERLAFHKKEQEDKKSSWFWIFQTNYVENLLTLFSDSF